MDKERLKQLAGNPQFISGIYNYCDRWCERCPFTSRCLNFATSEKQFEDPESRDIENEKFWQQLSETFQLTMEMVKEMAEEEGIDLDAIDHEEFEKEDRLKDEISESHQCCREAERYFEMVKEWFDSVNRLLEEDEDKTDPPIQLPEFRTFDEAPAYEDAIQVIRWYQYFIYVKLRRATRGLLDKESEEWDEYQKDSDGSAKIALIAIDRSIVAWGRLQNHFLIRKADILYFITHLKRLRRIVEETFPEARAFIRPGFDKIDLND